MTINLPTTLPFFRIMWRVARWIYWNNFLSCLSHVDYDRGEEIGLTARGSRLPGDWSERAPQAGLGGAAEGSFQTLRKPNRGRYRRDKADAKVRRRIGTSKSGTDLQGERRANSESPWAPRAGWWLPPAWRRQGPLGSVPPTFSSSVSGFSEHCLLRWHSALRDPGLFPRHRQAQQRWFAGVSEVLLSQ